VMLSLRVAIGPGVALLALLVVSSARRRWARCGLLVERLELLIIGIYWLLPLLVRIVRVVRHLNDGYGCGISENSDYHANVVARRKLDVVKQKGSASHLFVANPLHHLLLSICVC
jgi:hypothetical protein